MPTEILFMAFRITIAILVVIVFILIFNSLLRGYRARFFQKEKLNEDDVKFIDSYTDGEYVGDPSKMSAEKPQGPPIELMAGSRSQGIEPYYTEQYKRTKRMPPKPTDPLVSIILPQTLPGPGKTFAMGVDPYKKEDDDGLTSEEALLMIEYIRAMKERGYETL